MRVTVEWATGDLGVLPPIIVVNKLSGRHIETKARRVLVVPQPYTTAIFKYQICNFGLLVSKRKDCSGSFQLLKLIERKEDNIPRVDII
jgi:hypothetical protein